YVNRPRECGRRSAQVLLARRVRRPNRLRRLVRQRHGRAEAARGRFCQRTTGNSPLEQGPCAALANIDRGRPMSSPATRIWQGIEAEYPPCLRHDYAALLAMATRLHESRVKRFPALIDAGKLAPEAAAHQLEQFRQIAADWRWICTGEGEPAPHATIEDRREALDESLRTVTAIARERGGFDKELAQQADCLIALRWHLEPERQT